MTERERLLAVVAAARAFFDAAEYDVNMDGGDWGERMGPLARAMERAFAALDAHPPEEAGETVEVWVDPEDGQVSFVYPGTTMSRERAEYRHWTRLGTTRLVIEEDGA